MRLPRLVRGSLLLPLVLVFAAISGAAQSSPTSGTPKGPGTVLSAEQALEDFDRLRAALEEAHGGLYRYVSREETARRFADYRGRLNREIGWSDFAALIAEMLAGTHDGHMRLEYDSATTAKLVTARMFPLQVRIEGTRIVVLSNDTPSDTVIRPGMEIQRINRRSADELLAYLLPRVPGDGFIETGKRYRLGREFPRYYWVLVEQADTFEVTARDQNGRSVTTRVAGVAVADRQNNANPVNAGLKTFLARLDGPRENVSVRFLTEPDIAVLRVRGFVGDNYPAEIDSVFRLLRDRGTRVLILDLRHNGGGADLYGARLVSQFTDQPFRYFDRIRLTTISPSFATWKPSTFEDLKKGTIPDSSGGYLVTPEQHQGLAVQAPGATPFGGKLLVLINGGTFSTAADVTATLHHLKRATFIGEETGGGYQGNTSGLNALIVLPHSGLRLRIQMYDYWNPVFPAEPGRGTLADYPVETRIADLLRGADPQWERAVALAREAVAGRSP